MNPLLKWAGGKRKLTEWIAGSMGRYLDESEGFYYEPFLGGAAVALKLGRRKAFLSDANAALIDFYKELVEDPDNLHDLCAHYMPQSRDEYYDLRDNFELPLNTTQVAARLYCLNRCCFNGLWRENKSGKMNVPFSASRNVAHIDHFKAAHRKLYGKDVNILCKDFEEIINSAGPDDLIFADPPYDGGFVAYTAAGFPEEEQERLALTLRRAAVRGAAVLSTNADTKLIRELYDWADITPIEEYRKINSDVDGRGPVGCVVIEAIP